MSTSLTVQQGDGNDDAHQAADASGFTATNNQLICDYSVTASGRFTSGIRLPNVTIPSKATILSAVLRVTPTSTSFDSPASLETIFAEATDNSANFVTTASVVTRTLTTASKVWPGSDLGASQITSPDIRLVIQEVINRPGWVSGNALMVFIQGANSGGVEGFRLTSYNVGSAPTVFLDVVWEYWDSPDRLTRTAARGPAPGRISPATQPPDSTRDGRERAVYVEPYARPLARMPAPGMWAPASFPPDRLAQKQSTTVLPDPSPIFPPFHPPGHLCPVTSIDNGIWTAAERVPTRRTWYVSQSAGDDRNGGSSTTVRFSGTDAIINTTVGRSIITSPTATWTKAEEGHAINVGAVTGQFTGRLIEAITPARVVASVTTVSGNASISSLGLFTPDMVGQAITGTGIAANTVIQSYTSANTVGLSIVANGNGTNSVQLWASARTRVTASGGGALPSAATGLTYNIGGPWFSAAVALENNQFAGRSLISGGDTLYFGPGVYRETMTPLLAPDLGTRLNIIGDVDGAAMGVRGEVRFLNAVNDLMHSGSSIVISNSSSGFMGNISWSNIIFESCSNGTNVTFAGARNLTFTNCAFIASGIALLITCPADMASNILVDRCLFVSWTTTALSFQVPTSSIGNYDANIRVVNCQAMGFAGVGVQLASSGALTYMGGGLRIRNLTSLSASNGVVFSNSTAATGTCTVYDSFLTSASTALNATGTGAQVIEDYNILLNSVPRAVATTVRGEHSIANVWLTRGLGTFSWGQERLWGGESRYPLTPLPDNQALPLGTSDDTTVPVPSVDMANRPRPAGVGHLLASGTATSATSTTLTDSTATWPPSKVWQGATIKITGGLGVGQVKLILSHTATAVTLFTPWQLTPDSTSTYKIYFGAPAETMTCTSGTTTTATNTSAAYTFNMFTGFTYLIVSGTGAGTTGTVNTNQNNTLTFSTAQSVAIDNTSVLRLYRKTDENTVNRSVGALEPHDTALPETTLTDAGTVAWKIYGWGDQIINVPVDTTATTISIKCSFDSDHGNTNKPMLSVLADAEIGVSAASVTAAGTAGSGTFETLTLPAFTPTSQGWVQVLVRSRSDLPTGRAIFDTLAVA